MSNKELNKIIEESRKNIEKYDDKIFALLHSRFMNAETIGIIKHAQNIPITNKQRFDELVEKQVKKYSESGSHLSEHFIRKIYDVIHEESCRIQENIL